jgi:hypothetical protein
MSAQLQEVGLLEHEGYRPVFARDGFLVLHLVAARSAAN